MTPTYKEVSEYLEYDAITGDVTWIKSPASNVVVGSVAGNMNKAGYREIRVLNYRTYAHRIAFLLMTKRWPLRTVDHINGNRSDNRWTNLRDCSHADNMKNTRRKPGSTGYRGVEKNGEGYAARIRVNNLRLYLGQFDTAEEAAEAYNEAAELHHADFRPKACHFD